MLKPLMIGSAMLLAIPAFAQTGTTSTSTTSGQTGLRTSAPGTNTNTNTVTGQTGLPSSQTDTSWGTSTTTSNGMNTGTRTYATPSVTAGTQGTTGVTTGTTAGSWSNGAGTGYTGVGGPETDTSMSTTTGTRNYPRCSRTVRDSCIQGGPRRR